MSLGAAIVLLVIVLVVLLFAGMRLGFVVMTLGFFGLIFILFPAQPEVYPQQVWAMSFSYVLTAVPLFVLTAELLMRAGVTGDAYNAVRVFFGHIRGCAAYSSIGACAIFAALTGSSVANAAAVGTFAIPEMLKQGYDKKVAYGTCAAGGTLGILIPPSIPLIIYGALTGESVGRLFIAGVIPGIILSLMMMGAITIWGIGFPSSMPVIPLENYPWKKKVKTVLGLAPAILCIIIILGSIYAGITTPTEAAGLGATAALVIGLIKRKLSWSALRDSLTATVKLTAMVLLITTGANGVTYVMGFSGIPAALTSLVLEMGIANWQVLALISILYIILGCFLESVAIIVLTVPVLYPMIVKLGIDPIFFAILMVVLIETGMVTPPVGMNLYVIQGIAGENAYGDTVKGMLPFLFAMFVMVALLIAFPQMATWLPSRMGG